MNKNTSIYLDFLRVFSALGVIVCHANMEYFSSGLELCNIEFGHKMVVIFFVLSGFLIAYTTDIKNKDLHGYIVDRVSRLYPVIIPALFLTLFMDQIGYLFNPQYYREYVTSVAYYIKYIVTFFNLHEIWFSSAKPPTNVPFWSLAYEVWYYIIFAIWIYTTKSKRLMLLLLTVICIGYKMLLLFPVWLMGVALYKLSKLRISNVLAVFIFLVSICFIAGIITETIHPVFPFASTIGDPHFFFSYDFINDNFLGILICLNIFAMNSITWNIWNESSFFVQKVKWFSSVTFSVYLYHYPIMIFCGAIGFYNKGNLIQVLGLTLFIVLITILLAQVTEQKRYFIKQHFEKLYARYILRKKIMQ